MESNAFNVDKLNCMVDLHLHLDGAVSLNSARKLSSMQNIKIPQSDNELKRLITVSGDCSSLDEFLEKFEFPVSLLQTYDSIVSATENLLDELYEQGVMYAEIRFAPQLCTRSGLSQEEAVMAALDGIKRSKIPANIILCCMRGDNNQNVNIQTVEVAEKYLEKGVAALDLAGAESKYNTRNYKELFDLAKKKGIPFTIHAGEADGPQSVKTALSYGAVRIGHGVRSVEDIKLLRELSNKQIPLELCPTSNVCTAVYKNLKDWPLQKLMDNGVYITINTDDPAIEDTNIKSEYKKLISEFGISKADVERFLRNAVNASFADNSLKQMLNQKITAQFQEN